VHSSSDSRDREASALAALLGHELNNIAVPLDGFTELAVQGTAADAPVRHSLIEVQIAIERIKSLAAELEILGETESRTDSVAIADCMPPLAVASAPATLTIEWRCTAATLVRADSLHLRSAIQALLCLAQRTSSAFEGPTSLMVSQRVPPAQRCTACGAAVASGADSVLIEVHATRAMLAAALRAPFANSRAMRLGSRLTLGVLVHSVHCAGGHILLDEPSALLSVVLAAG